MNTKENDELPNFEYQKLKAINKNWKGSEMYTKMIKSVCIITLLAAFSCLAISADWSFKKIKIADTAADSDPDDIMAADIDGDGDSDFIITEDPNMIWYENVDGDASRWERHICRSDGRFMGTTVGDFDGDGDLDIATNIATNAKRQTIWMENDGKGNGWERHNLPITGSAIDNMRAFDYNNDGRDDLIIERYGYAHLYYCPSPDNPKESWSSYKIGTGSGLSIGDVDKDGDMDVITGGKVLICPPNPAQADWNLLDMKQVNDSYDKSGVGDINRDGYPDIVFSQGEGKNIKIVFGPDWNRSHAVMDSADVGLHTMHLVDFDGDGDLDIFSAEIHNKGRTFLFENADGTGTKWIAHLQTKGDPDGNHNAWVADFNNDGMIDLLGKHYSGGEISIWINTLSNSSKSSKKK